MPTDITHADFPANMKAFSETGKDDLLAQHQADESVSLMNTGPDFGNVAIAVYHPRNNQRNAHCLVWFHPGGLIAGHYLADYVLSKSIVKQVGCTFISVEYRLAPEHPYPAGVNDGYDVIRWVADSQAGFTPKTIAVGGASGGGPFATGSGLKAIKKGIDICFQILITPMLDYSSSTESVNFSRDPKNWNRDNNRYAWDAYLAGIDGQAVPGEASPIAADDFSLFPPTYMSVGDVDIFRDEAIDYARHLTRAGVPVELHILPKCAHGGDLMIADDHPFKIRMIGEYARALTEAFDSN